MAATVQTLVEAPQGYRSVHVARTMWQLDDLSRRLVETTDGLSPAALAWQPTPGTNTIGMLLAHIAVAEAHITAVGLEGKPDSDLPAVIGISMDDDGMPLPPDGHPPAALAGKDVAFFNQLLDRARNNTRRVAAGLTDSDLGRQVARNRPDGTRRIFNLEWVLYHMVEHEAGHFGQILLLRHLSRVLRPGG
jgi:uncharacterized damage-inducible protein DinB